MQIVTVWRSSLTLYVISTMCIVLFLIRSGGNKRKLSTAIALVGNPPIVFLVSETVYHWDYFNILFVLSIVIVSLDIHTQSLSLTLYTCTEIETSWPISPQDKSFLYLGVQSGQIVLVIYLQTQTIFWHWETTDLALKLSYVVWRCGDVPQLYPPWVIVVSLVVNSCL